LVGLQPDIILALGARATAALQRETRTIPIVFAGASDPVVSGIVARLDRPSGNVTGFAANEASLGGKWLELLSEIAPGLKRAAFMFNPDTVPVSVYVHRPKPAKPHQLRNPARVVAIGLDRHRLEGIAHVPRF
jgi:putative ABC transport system substrate-binding protein